MKGSIREKPPGSGSWELRVYVGRDPVTRRPKQISRMFSGGKRAANTELARLVTEAQEGRHGGSSATVGQLLDSWLATAKGAVTGSTYATYESTADRLKGTSLAQVKLSRLDPHDIDVAYVELQKSGVTDHVMVQVDRYLGTAIRQAMKWGWIRSNPQALAKKPHKPKVEPKSMKPGDVLALVVEAQKTDPDLAAIILLAAKTGLRRGELAALKWSDIDGNVLTVRRSHSIVKGEVIIGPPKMRRESDEPDTITLSQISMDALTDVYAGQVGKAQSLDTDLPEDGYVLSADGLGHSPRRPDRLGREIREAGERIKVEASPHRLRHFMASDLIRSKADIATVSTRMRHRDQALTLRTYVHDDGSQASDAADLLDVSLLMPDVDPKELAS